MKYRKYFKVGLIIALSLFIASVSIAKGPNPRPLVPAYLTDGWNQISPEAGFTYLGLSPACSNCPGLPNTPYTFFVRKGAINKVLIFFDGGGACWDPMNCIQWPYVNMVLNGATPPSSPDYINPFTYTPFISENVISGQFFDGANPIDEGIFDFDDPRNPFKDWYVVYLPYCTGDLFWGANDYAYPDEVGTFAGVPQTIHHRGFVNFQAVLKWVKVNFKNPKQMFVTGSSAGGYGAIMDFPFIKNAFPAVRVDVLGDAANGITGDNFNAKADLVWDVQYPAWIFPEGVDDLTSEDLYMNIAAEYPFSKLAQYTAAFDSTQIWFYHLQLDDIVGQPVYWYDTAGIMAAYPVWNYIMSAYVHDTAAGASNYRYYMAKGQLHTILTRDAFYTENSAGGIYFYAWIKGMIDMPNGLGVPPHNPWKNLENNMPY